MLYIPYPFKRCTQCGVEYRPTTEFFRANKYRNKLRPNCRRCDCGYAQLVRRNNPELARERDKIKHRKYYEANTDKVKRKARAWEKDHREYKNNKTRVYKHIHSEKTRESNRRYRQSHLDQYREYKKKRSAKQSGLPATFTKHDWQIALDYFHSVCAYCGNPPTMFDRHGLHQDHYIPSSNNGGYVPENIVPACENCNLSKSNRNPDEWVRRRFGNRRSKAILNNIRAFFESVTIRH